jgi:hypothetical protein
MLESEQITSEHKRVTHTFLSGKLSSTLIIPIDTARKYGLDKPVNVVIEEKAEGILIKRLNI